MWPEELTAMRARLGADGRHAPSGAGLSLQANVQAWRGKQYRDRKWASRYLGEQVKQHQDAGEPVISVGTRKRKQLSQLPNAGREWRSRGQAVRGGGLELLVELEIVPVPPETQG